MLNRDLNADQRDKIVLQTSFRPPISSYISQRHAGTPAIVIISKRTLMKAVPSGAKRREQTPGILWLEQHKINMEH